MDDILKAKRNEIDFILNFIKADSTFEPSYSYDDLDFNFIKKAAFDNRVCGLLYNNFFCKVFIDKQTNIFFEEQYKPQKN